MTKRTHKANLDKATTINELVYIESQIKQDMSLDCDSLLALVRYSDGIKEAFKAAGQKYTIARKPAWM